MSGSLPKQGEENHKQSSAILEIETWAELDAEWTWRLAKGSS